MCQICTLLQMAGSCVPGAMQCLPGTESESRQWSLSEWRQPQQLTMSTPSESTLPGHMVMLYAIIFAASGVSRSQLLACSLCPTPDVCVCHRSPQWQPAGGTSSRRHVRLCGTCTTGAQAVRHRSGHDCNSRSRLADAILPLHSHHVPLSEGCLTQHCVSRQQMPALVLVVACCRQQLSHLVVTVACCAGSKWEQL